MTAAQIGSGRIERLLGALWRGALVLAVLAMAVLPDGVMPARGADGQTTFLICSGEGPVLMVLDTATGVMKPAPAKAAGRTCDWAMAHACWGTVALAPQALPPLPILATVLAPSPPCWRRAHDPLGIWARGPPVSV